MSRSVKFAWILALALLLPVVGWRVPVGPDGHAVTRARQPNIIYIVADDLGYGELGCYGQKLIRTPNIDELARKGMRFTEHYSGSPVCAPSRCVLLTGLHTGHAYIRNNKGAPIVGQEPILPDTPTLARRLQKAGYKTACVGKWGLGGPDTTGVPWKQGFDFFFGYLDQWRAHNYYPTYLYRNEQQVPLDNPDFAAHQKIDAPHASLEDYKQYAGNDYAPDLIIEEGLDFIRQHKGQPFFLFYATTIPHVAIQVPEESVNAYPEEWDTQAYLGQKGYLPHPRPRAAYAGMITRFDTSVGRIVDLLDELNLTNDTLIIFTSDNGPTYAGGVDYDFFQSAGPLRGLKGSVFEGGIRVPMIAVWPGRIGPGSTTDHVSGFQDVMPTLLDVLGVSDDGLTELDGISFAPTLLGRGEQREHEVLYWELGSLQALRHHDWKIVRTTNRNTDETTTYVFNLADDPSERTNLVQSHPDMTAQLLSLIRRARTPSSLFPSAYDDGR